MHQFHVLWTGGWDSTFMLIKLLSNRELTGGRSYLSMSLMLTGKVMSMN